LVNLLWVENELNIQFEMEINYIFLKLFLFLESFAFFYKIKNVEKPEATTTTVECKDEVAQ